MPLHDVVLLPLLLFDFGVDDHGNSSLFYSAGFCSLHCIDIAIIYEQTGCHAASSVSNHPIADQLLIHTNAFLSPIIYHGVKELDGGRCCSWSLILDFFGGRISTNPFVLKGLTIPTSRG